MKPHKHAALIKAWADGALIQQYKPHLDEWHDTSPYPVWDDRVEYRIKPELKLKKMYLYFVGKEEQKLWITDEPPETYLYRAISQYIGQVEVLV